MLLRTVCSSTGAATRRTGDRPQPGPASSSTVARGENRDSAGGMVETACYDSSVVTACLDRGLDGRAVGCFRFALVGACLLVLGTACAPRAVHRTVELGDAGEEDGAGGTI